MNWGKALTLAMVLFAGMMTWFVIKASQNPMPLVTEDYYGAELKFQGRIDEAARAKALSAPVAMVVERTAVDLRFPDELAGKRIAGTFTLLRPNDPRADRTLSVAADSAHFLATGLDLVAGRYNALLEWEVEGVKYYMEDKVYVP